MKTLTTILITILFLGILPEARAGLSTWQLKKKVERQRTKFNAHYINPNFTPGNRTQTGKLAKMLLHSRLQRFHANEVIQRKGLSTCGQALAEMPSLISGEYLLKKADGTFRKKTCTFDPTTTGRKLTARNDNTPPSIEFAENTKKRFHQGEEALFQFNVQDTHINAFPVPSSGLTGGQSKVICRWNYSSWQNCRTGIYKTTSLPPGSHTLTIRAKDANGNMAEKRRKFRILHSNILLSWSGLGSGHHYSIDFRRIKQNGEMVTFAPCIDAGIVKTSTSYRFRRKCHSSGSNVSMNMFRSQIRVCAAHYGQWGVKGKVICTEYKDANASSLHFQFRPRTGLLKWNTLGSGFKYRLDVRSLKGNGKVRKSWYGCVNSYNLGSSGSYRFDRYCRSHSQRPVVSFNSLQVRICAAKDGKWQDPSKKTCTPFADFRGGTKSLSLTRP